LRGLATRYDDHDLIYRGALLLHNIIRWLNEYETRPDRSALIHRWLFVVGG
jgi:hypothetical protein